MAEARRRGLRLLPRSAGLAATMAGRRVVAVAGTHGKTTTTSLLTCALLACDAQPTYAVGGLLSTTGRNADAGAGSLFVAEADESDGAFLVYSPFAAIVTNVAADHLDQWGTEEAYRAAFTEFVGRIDGDGFLVACVDDPGAALSPMPGSVVEVLVDEGQDVVRGDVLVVVEAMKMEHRIAADVDGVVSEVRVSAGSQVEADDVLVVVRADDAE